MPYFTVAIWTLVLLFTHAHISGYHLPISLTLRIGNCGVSDQLPILPGGNPESKLQYFRTRPVLQAL